MKYLLILLGLCLMSCNNPQVSIVINSPKTDISDSLSVKDQLKFADTASLVVKLKKAGTLQSVLEETGIFKEREIIIDTLTLEGYTDFSDMCYLSDWDKVLHLNLKDAVFEDTDSCFGGLSRSSKLKTVLLPTNINKVSFNAFVDCVNLEEVQISESLKYTGKDAIELSKNEFTNDFTNGFKQIHFQYKQPVNGYIVKGILAITDWLPKLYNEKDVSSVRGAVILELSKNGERFHVTHYPFYLYSSAFYGYNEFIKGSNFYLNYNSEKCSFCFDDLDFDGEKELVFRNCRERQRFLATYTVYSLGENLGLGENEHVFYRRTDPPFNELDAYTEFDEEKQEIKLHLSGGATFWEDRIYKCEGKRNINFRDVNSFRLMQIIERENDTIFYYTGDRKLIRREIVKDEE